MWPEHAGEAPMPSISRIGFGLHTISHHTQILKSVLRLEPRSVSLHSNYFTDSAISLAREFFAAVDW